LLVVVVVVVDVVIGTGIDIGVGVGALYSCKNWYCSLNGNDSYHGYYPLHGTHHGILVESTRKHRSQYS
jgi:hypothetical protein